MHGMALMFKPAFLNKKSHESNRLFYMRIKTLSVDWEAWILIYALHRKYQLRVKKYDPTLMLSSYEFVPAKMLMHDRLSYASEYTLPIRRVLIQA